MVQTRHLWIVACLLVIMLAGCDVATPVPATPTAAPPVTLTPPAAITYTEGCTTDDLENWLESTDYLMRDFVAAMNQAENQTPAEVRAGMTRMVSLRDALLAVPAPAACAGEAQEEIAALLNEALNAFQQYGNGDSPDTRSLMGEVDILLGRIQDAQVALRDQLDAQFQSEQQAN